MDLHPIFDGGLPVNRFSRIGAGSVVVIAAMTLPTGTAFAVAGSPHIGAASGSCDKLPPEPAFGPRGPNTNLKLSGLHPCQPEGVPIVNDAVRGPNSQASYTGKHPAQPPGTPIVNEAVRGPNTQPSFTGKNPAQPAGTPIVNPAVRGPNTIPSYTGKNPPQPAGTPIVNDAVRGPNTQPSFGNTGGPGVIAAATG